MHTQFKRNLAKMMVFAIAIPTVYTNANVSYEKDGVIYIDNNVEITTTTGSAIEIDPSEPVGTDGNSVGTEEDSVGSVDVSEMLPPESVGIPDVTVPDNILQEAITDQAINVVSLSIWDGVNMVEPQVQGDVYSITCADELAWLEDQVNSGNLDTTGITVTLANDIDFNGHSVIIGTETYPFKGDFNGGGYTIRNLDFSEKIEPPKYVTNLGLFGYVEGSAFYNLNMDIEVSSISGPSVTNMGFLIAYADNLKELRDIQLNLLGKDEQRSINKKGMLIAKLDHDESEFAISNIKIVAEFNGEMLYSSCYGGIVGSLTAKNGELNIKISDVDLDFCLDGRFTTSIFGGIFGELNSVKGGTFIVDNFNVDFKSLKTKGSLPSMAGITSTLCNFEKISITNSSANTNIEKFNYNVGGSSSGAFISSIYNYNGNSNKTEILLENCKVTGDVVDYSGAALIESIRDGSNKTIDVIIKDCTSDVNNTSSGSMYMRHAYGGLIGVIRCSTLDITNCTSYGDVSSSPNITGGLFGQVEAKVLKVSDCANYGKVNGVTYVGGLFGSITTTGSASDSIISNCTNYGTVEGGSLVGGLCATASGSYIIDSFKSLGGIGRNEKASASGCIGGIFGQSSGGSDFNEFRNCYVDLKITSTYGQIGGLVGYYMNGTNLIAKDNEIVGKLEDTFDYTAQQSFNFGGLFRILANVLNVTVQDNKVSNIKLSSVIGSEVHGGLIGEIVDSYKIWPTDSAVVKGNTLENVTIDTSVSDTNIGSGLIGSCKITGNLLIEENSIDNLEIKTSNPYNSTLVTILKDEFDTNKKVEIRNNLVKASIKSSVESADLVGNTEIETSFGGNILIVEGTDLKNGALEIKQGIDVTFDIPNYYNKDVRNEVTTPLFVELSTEEFKDMGNFKGIDFDNIWGYSDDCIWTPTLGKQTYSIDIDNELSTFDVCMASSEPISIAVSHPSILGSLVFEVDDDSIARVEQGKIIPLKEGTTQITVRSVDLPLSNQLEATCTIVVKDRKPALELNELTIYQGQKLPTAVDIVDSFKLVHPFDNLLDEDATQNATYTVEIKDTQGLEVAGTTADNVGIYEVSVTAEHKGYTVTETVDLVVNEIVENVVVDDSKINVEFGTELTKDMLPSKAEVTYTDGSSSDYVDLDWNINGYNSSLEGEYIVVVTIKLPNDLVWNGSNEVFITKAIEVMAENIAVPEQPVTPPESENPSVVESDDDKEWHVQVQKPTETVEKPIEQVKPIETILKVSFMIGKDRWLLNDKEVETLMDKTPELKDNRAYVPIRFLSYALQVKEDNIKWDNNSKVVEIVDGENNMRLQIGSNIAYINGECMEMDGTPYLAQGRVMLPISQIQGVFKNRDPHVEWDQDEKRVDITLTILNYKGHLVANTEKK